MRLAETLAAEFTDIPGSAVVRALAQCVQAYPFGDQYFIEHAARARLTAVRRARQQVDLGAPDVLDVSLHDPELDHEVELTANLIVAANEAEGPLSREEVDRLLGLPRRSFEGC